jgi:peptidoglycan-associated lipoprotein
MRQSISLVWIAATIAACACGGTDKKPAAAAPVWAPAMPSAAPPTTASNPKPDDDATRGNLNISDEIRKACGLTEAEAFFAFDSAHVRAEDQQVLKKLADCFSTGALKGREMRLVGHADPRGSADYNLALGGRRADNVKNVIVGQGMSSSKVATTSRGAMDATGVDEASWAKDRRVDVTLGD